ncbi:hypothetical protein ES702_02317 [subsurface metagenome]
MKDKITSKEPMTIWIRCYDKEIFEEPFLVRANKIELSGNHLLFYLDKELIFKVWLKLDKWENYKDINEALKDVGIEII